jgi:hypothetical protein
VCRLSSFPHGATDCFVRLRLCGVRFLAEMSRVGPVSDDCRCRCRCPRLMARERPCKKLSGEKSFPVRTTLFLLPLAISRPVPSPDLARRRIGHPRIKHTTSRLGELELTAECRLLGVKGLAPGSRQQCLVPRCFYFTQRKPPTTNTIRAHARANVNARSRPSVVKPPASSRNNKLQACKLRDSIIRIDLQLHPLAARESALHAGGCILASLHSLDEL